MYDVSSAATMYGGGDILAAIFLGAIGGIFGGLYNYLIDRLLRVYSIINEYVPGRLSPTHFLVEELVVLNIS